MTVKKKLIVSNILMIVIPVLLALLFVIVSFKTVGNRYWESMEEMYDDKSGIYSAQSILFAYKNEIRDRSDLEYQKSEDGRTKVSLEKTNVMVSLEQELQDLGYHFRIRLDEETLWSTITHEDEERMEEYFEEDYDNLGLLTLSEKDLSIVKNTFEHDGKIFELAAVHTQERRSAGIFRILFSKIYYDLYSVLCFVYCDGGHACQCIFIWLDRSVDYASAEHFERWNQTDC